MGSSKTANALMACYNYKEKGQTPVLLKPRQDTRDGERMIRSRIGLGEHCLFVDEFLAKVQDPQGTARKGLEAGKYAAVIVDEAQFLTAGEVDSLSDIVDSYGTPVLCYGLRIDFTGRLFEGAMRLFETADVIEEVPTVCWCGKRARFNARIKDGRNKRLELA